MTTEITAARPGHGSMHCDKCNTVVVWEPTPEGMHWTAYHQKDCPIVLRNIEALIQEHTQGKP